MAVTNGKRAHLWDIFGHMRIRNMYHRSTQLRSDLWNYHFQFWFDVGLYLCFWYELLLFGWLLYFYWSSLLQLSMGLLRM